ncbi:hypothetical protein AMECASPLE_039332 [Ameca splendens]|uniref:Hexosyltransferase n=1 Tax=Ameca splendens TaxID=208324 RepID=A0ABV0Y8U1_9TELE
MKVNQLFFFTLHYNPMNHEEHKESRINFLETEWGAAHSIPPIPTKVAVLSYAACTFSNYFNSILTDFNNIKEGDKVKFCYCMIHCLAKKKQKQKKKTDTHPNISLDRL